MTWTTSADPWANGIRKDARRTLRTNPLKQLIFDAKFVASAVPVLAVGHLCLIALLTPTLAEPEVCALLLLSGAALLIAATAAGDVRDEAAREASQETHASTTRFAVTTPLVEHAPERGSERPSPRPAPTTIAAGACAFRANAHNSDWADLMARVSHELRTPLNAVLGFSDLMDRATFGPLGHHRYQEYARHIHESGRDLLKSAEDTLAVTSLLATPKQQASSEAVDLANLVADAWGFFGRLPITKDVKLEIEVPAGTDILCDRRSMRQVLVNLLSEALTRSTPGTTIRLATSFVPGQIGVTIAVPPTPSQAQREPGSLHVCLARTLLEFRGALLAEHLCDQTGWRASTYLECADQADFFLSCGDFPRHTACA